MPSPNLIYWFFFLTSWIKWTIFKHLGFQWTISLKIVDILSSFHVKLHFQSLQPAAYVTVVLPMNGGEVLHDWPCCVDTTLKLPSSAPHHHHPENRPWLWVLFRVLARLTASMIQSLTLCEHATTFLHLQVQVNLWTHTVWYGGGERQTQRDRLLLLRWVFPIQLRVLYKVPERSCRYSESPEPDERKTIQLTRKCLMMWFFSAPFKWWTHKSPCFTRGHPDSRRQWSEALRPHYNPNQFQNNACFITVMTLDCVIIPCRCMEAAEIYRIHKKWIQQKMTFLYHCWHRSVDSGVTLHSERGRHE